MKQEVPKMVGLEVMTVVGALKLLPEVVEIGRDIWKKLKPPEQLAEGVEGVLGNTYYSDQHKFTMSMPDDNWRFWKPTPQFIASFEVPFPTRDTPIMILSKQVINLYRPNVLVTVEDVGSFTNINELTDITVQNFTKQGATIKADDVHVSSNTNSSVIIATRPFYKATMYQVQQSYIYASKGYYVVASYVPASDKSPSLFGGLQDIMNSFKLIK
jgi:hypothetical protein